MYRYLQADIAIARKKLSPKAIYVWVPVQVIHFSECRPKELYIVDCYFRSLIDNPYLSVLLLRKIPKLKDVKYSDIQTIDVKKIYCECRDVVGDLRRIVDDVDNRDFSKLFELLDYITEYKDVEFTTRVFFRTRRYVIRAEQIKEMDRRLATKITEKLMNRLCLYDSKEKSKKYTSIAVEKFYALLYLDPILGTSGILIGKHLIEVKTYLKIIKKLDLGKEFSLDYSEPQKDMHLVYRK
jgi:hypothetical protein